MKVAIITNVIASYRRGFYEALSEKDVDFSVFCQSHMPGFNLKPIQKELGIKLVEVPFFSLKQEKAAWQWLPIRKLWSDFDIYVFYGNPRILSNVIWATLLKLLGKPVVIWGQGHGYGANPITERLRLFWWRFFNYILVYTDEETHQLKQNGFKNTTIIGANNGLDQRQIDTVSSFWNADKLEAWRIQQGITEKKIILSSARLAPEKHFELIIDALPMLIEAFPELLWVVIGDGLLKTQLQTQARNLNVANHIRWLGAIYDEKKLAPWFLSSEALIHPGAIGLSLFHAFGYGLPVITHHNAYNHGPEFAAMEDGVSGLLFQENDETSLRQQIERMLENNQLKELFKNNALDIARTKYNTQIMADRFVDIVRQCYDDYQNRYYSS